MIWLRAVGFVLLVQVTVVALIPWALRVVGPRFDPGPGKFIGLTAVGAGIVLLAWCNVLFVRQGQGTAAPYDPPRQLVIVGPYRCVRNPMYLSALIIVFGLGLWLGVAAILAYAMVLAVAYHLFVQYYEEPRLTSTFGPAYLAYTRLVPRWWPRRTFPRPPTTK